MKALGFLVLIFLGSSAFADGFHVSALDKYVDATGGKAVTGHTPSGVRCEVTITSEDYGKYGKYYYVHAEAAEKGPWSDHNEVQACLTSSASNAVIAKNLISWGTPFNPEDAVAKLEFNDAGVVTYVEAKDYGYGGGPIDFVKCHLR